ncbi:MAG: hypothetical protein SGILL_008199 [Bacillariaceae sp.]
MQLVANLTESSVLGSSGQTVVLTTVATGADNHDSNQQNKEPTTLEEKSRLLKPFLIEKCQRESPSSMIPLTVDYRQRHHAVGKIPTSANRADNRRPTDAETLASRAIDRALRPLLQTRPLDLTSAVHVTCSIQACPVASSPFSGGGHPVALALNAASVALGNKLKEPVAAVYLCLMKDGRVLQDPPSSISSQNNDASDDNNGVLCELLFAGTNDSVVMMEFAGQLVESKVMELIEMAHTCIQPRIEMQLKANAGVDKKAATENDEEIRESLGLGKIANEETRSDSSFKIFKIGSQDLLRLRAIPIYDEAYKFCKQKLGDVPLRLFGVPTKATPASSTRNSGISIHSEEVNGPLPGKAARGRREHLVHEEIRRILQDFLPSGQEFLELYQAMLVDDDSVRSALSDSIGSRLLKEAMQQAAVKYGCRADGRNTNTIRPLAMDVPALPDVVHGSAVFTRGETQVLCTTTLGPPKDGILLNDPYISPPRNKGKDDGATSPYKDLPVGSLRYLRNQEYLESDMNSRKVKASREQTGDSGTLRERRRAFLQYDFPSYSKGEVQTGPGASASRREIGHGE